MDDDNVVLGSVDVTLPDWVPTTPEIMRAALSQQAADAHGVVDEWFDRVDVQQEQELRRNLVAQGLHVGEVAVQAMLVLVRRESFRRRMEAHRDLAVLIEGFREQRETAIAYAERSISGVPLQ